KGMISLSPPTICNSAIRHMFGAFAEFERNRIRERTLDGLEKAKANGVKLGRKEATDTTQKVQELRSEGLSQSKVAKRLSISVSTVKRHWNKGEG
ncbi:TPA: recombinase family protein, partial [Escherichia coli]